MATPFWYNAALALVKPLYRWRIKKRASSVAQYQQECLERFGPFQTPKNTQAIWFHAVSVGETNAAQPLIQHYLNAGYAVLVTNTTKTGQARAQTLFLNEQYQALFQAVFLPADQIFLLEAFFAKYQPRLLLLVETELWPNLIDQAQAHDVPTLLINARLSEKSARAYGKVPALTRSMLQSLQKILAQDQDSAERFMVLGSQKQMTSVLGSIKFDIQPPMTLLNLAAELKQSWQLGARKVLTLASTHAPEEADILAALTATLQQNPDYVCIVVPRHPERFDEVFAQCQHLGLQTQRRSLGQAILPNTQVYLADSMGELWLWYALSQACFVGGSLNTPGGGHNVLEPLTLQVATVIGPHYFNFQNIVDAFVQQDAIRIAENAEQVVDALLACVQQQALAQHMAQRAAKVLQRNQGALAQHIAVIDAYL